MIIIIIIMIIILLIIIILIVTIIKIIIIIIIIQVNLDMTDSVGPGKLVRHMRNPSYAYERLSPSYASVYLIALGTSVDLYIKAKTAKEYFWLDFYYTYICLLRNTRQCELSSVWPKVTQHMC